MLAANLNLLLSPWVQAQITFPSSYLCRLIKLWKLSLANQIGVPNRSKRGVSTFEKHSHPFLLLLRLNNLNTKNKQTVVISHSSRRWNIMSLSSGYWQGYCLAGVATPRYWILQRKQMLYLTYSGTKWDKPSLGGKWWENIKFLKN